MSTARHESQEPWSRGEERTLCRAPELQLYLYPTGDVRACCRSLTTLGNIAQRPLSEIWRGSLRHEMIRSLRSGDWPLGCQGCEAEVDIEGRDASFPATFDYWHEQFSEVEQALAWPARIEFNLSNTCNLQCIQCSGESSSSIRIHREKRPPMAAVYGPEFFEDIVQFLPHLHRASFAGGEPFLGAENFRLWDLVASEADELPCTIITNATQWNERVERVLETVTVHPIVSIDGATRATYESIRVGANFDKVVRNIDRLRSYSAAAGTSMSLNFCLMPENVHEFPDMLLFAEERGLYLDVCVVRGPVEHSLARMSPVRLRPVVEQLELRSEEMEGSLRLNRRSWIRELERLQTWCASDSNFVSSWSARTPTLLVFPRQGRPSSPRSPIADEADGPLERYELRIGADELIARCPAALAKRLGMEPNEIEGRSLTAIHPALRRLEIVEHTDDRYVATFVVDDGAGRITIVPDRDPSGWADEMDVVFEFDDHGD